MTKIVLVGAGNMGGAMLRGWLSAGVERDEICVIDPKPRPETLEMLAETGVQHLVSPEKGMSISAVFLAIKPQLFDVVLKNIAPFIQEQTIIVSVAAGKTIANMKSHLGSCSVVRAMPNTPAMIGRGITGAVCCDNVSDEQKALADQLLLVSGKVEWLSDEALIDAVTAVSGSGPAYVFYLAECMAQAGVKAGLPPELARRLAEETVSGAGELLYRSSDKAAVLRKNVTSPGGTTAAALAILMEDNRMVHLFEEAILKAQSRSVELAG